MSSLNLESVKEASDTLYQLSTFFQIPLHRISAGVVRKANRSLILLKSVITADIIDSCKTWTRAHAAYDQLMSRATEINVCLEEEAQLERLFAERQKENQKWCELTAEQRERFEGTARMAQEALAVRDVDLTLFEDYIARYRKYQNAMEHSQHADKVYDAIRHYENLFKYQENIEILRVKREQLQTKMSSTSRGLFFTALLCLLIVTIPLALPFLLSLWSRKREILGQIKSMEESMRREEKRIKLAEESAELVENLMQLCRLDKPSDLREHFAGAIETINRLEKMKEKFPHLVGSVLQIEKLRPELEAVFESAPEGAFDTLRWIVAVVTDARRQSEQLVQMQHRLESAREKNILLLKGYSVEKLNQTLSVLLGKMNDAVQLPGPEETKSQLVHLILNMPQVMTDVHDCLEMLNRGVAVVETHWQDLGRRLSSLYYLISACVMSEEVFGFVEDECAAAMEA